MQENLPSCSASYYILRDDSLGKELIYLSAPIGLSLWKCNSIYPFHIGPAFSITRLADLGKVALIGSVGNRYSHTMGLSMLVPR